MPPFVSICIPCFNAERWLEACILSALQQTGPEVEVIVVDDGSTDASVEIAKSFGDKVQWRTSHGKGAPAARNTALYEAQGEWVQFLDADDYLLPGKIETQLLRASAYPSAGLIVSPTVTENMSDGSRTPGHFTESYDAFCLWISWEMPQTGGALWRRDALATLEGWNESMPCCQEHELYLRALKAGVKILRDPAALAIYRIWSEETLCRKDPIKVIHIRTGLIDECRAWMDTQGIWTDAHQRVAGRACFEMARTMAKYNLAEAAAYHEERKRAGLIHLTAPAAPPSYQAAYAILGFRGAEELANRIRRR